MASVHAALKGAAGIFPSVDEAVSNCVEGAGKTWAVLAQDDNTLAEVQKALSSGAPIGVAVHAPKAPVSQFEVLRACEYGEVYVAATTVTAAAKAVQEATSYGGPAVLLLAESNAVTADAQWTPFTYDPRREQAGESAFIADTESLRKELAGFVARENLLTLCAKKSLPDIGGGDGSALAEGLMDAGKTVTILYTSDTGHAEECAKAIGRQCRNGGYATSAVRLSTMDAFDIGALASEPLVVFCVATAGKGEFPGNGRAFWDKLNQRSDLDLSGLKYCVFGLGDSHY